MSGEDVNAITSKSGEADGEPLNSPQKGPFGDTK